MCLKIKKETKGHYNQRKPNLKNIGVAWPFRSGLKNGISNGLDCPGSILESVLPVIVAGDCLTTIAFILPSYSVASTQTPINV